MLALRTEPETSAVIARVPLELKAALVKRARDNERSVSGELRALLTAALERSDDETEAA